MQGLQIRESTQADIDSIQKINALAWNNSFKDVFTKDVLENINLKARSEWHQDIPESPQTKTIVGIMDNEIVAYCKMGPLRDPANLSWISNSTFDEHANDWGEIYSIYVLKSYSRLGVGKTLFEHAKNIFKNLGYNKFQSYVLADNVRTIRFYESLGCIAKITRDWNYMGIAYKEIGLVFYL